MQFFKSSISKRQLSLLFLKQQRFFPQYVSQCFFASQGQPSSSDDSSNVKTTSNLKDNDKKLTTTNSSIESKDSSLPEGFIKDYTDSPTVIKFSSDSPESFKSNTDSELQLKDNPLALKVFMEGQIDLRDKRVQMQSLDIQDSTFLTGQGSDIKQINLGDVVVKPKNSILLEDLDVYNIPEDKDVIIDKNEKVLMAVGRKLEGRKSKNTVNELSEVKEKQNEASFIHQVGKNVFEEKLLSEFGKENLFQFEREYLVLDYRQLLRRLIAGFPFLLLLGNLTFSFMELHACKESDFAIEEQEMRYLQNLRKQYANQILVSNPLFDRRKYADLPEKK